MKDSSVRPHDTVAPIDINTWMSEQTRGLFQGQLPQPDETTSLPRPTTSALSSVSPTSKPRDNPNTSSTSSSYNTAPSLHEQPSSLSPPIDRLAQELHVSTSAPTFDSSHVTMAGQSEAPLEVDSDQDTPLSTEEMESYALQAILKRKQTSRYRVRTHRLPSRSASATSDNAPAFSKPIKPEETPSDPMACDEGYSEPSDTDNLDIVMPVARRRPSPTRVNKGSTRVRYRRAIDVAQSCTNAVPKAPRMRKRKVLPRPMPMTGEKGLAVREAIGGVL